MKKGSRLLAVAIVMVMAFSAVIIGAAHEADAAVDTWDGTSVETGWYSDGSPEFTIDSAAELAGLAQLVNQGNNFSGKTVTLAADIDLDNKEWTPIGTSDAPFNGIFNGDNFTISNMYINKGFSNTVNNSYVGLFGLTNSPAVIKNLVFENVDIQGSLYVGTVVGYGFTGSEISNVTVKGDIFIDAWWYAGVIGGNGYVNIVTDCHVIGNDGSYIKGNEVSGYIGGIWGYRGEGDHSITKCTVENLDIYSYDRVGGIAGIAHYQNTISDCSLKDVKIFGSDDYYGTVALIAGANLGSDSNGPSYVINNIIENTTATMAGAPVTKLTGNTQDGLSYTSIIGTDVVLDSEKKVVFGNLQETVPDKYISGGSSLKDNPDGTFTVVSNEGTDYVAFIGTTGFETIGDAFDHSISGDTIILVADVKISESLKVDNKNVTLKGHHTIIRLDSYVDSIVSVSNSGILTIDGPIFDGENKASESFAPLVIANSGSEVILVSGSIQNNGSTGIYLNGATFVMNGGSVSGNSAIGGSPDGLDGGGIRSYYSTVEINDGSISGNTADRSGAAICAIGGNVEINGGTISGNVAVPYSVDDNTTYGAGGIVYVECGSLSISGGEIVDNTVYETNTTGNSAIVLFGDNSTSGKVSGGTVSGNKFPDGKDAWSFHIAGADDDTTYPNLTLTGNPTIEGVAYLMDDLTEGPTITIYGNFVPTEPFYFFKNYTDMDYNAILASGNAEVEDGMIVDSSNTYTVYIHDNVVTFTINHDVKFISRTNGEVETLGIIYVPEGSSISSEDIPEVTEKPGYVWDNTWVDFYGNPVDLTQPITDGIQLYVNWKLVDPTVELTASDNYVETGTPVILTVDVSYGAGTGFYKNVVWYCDGELKEQDTTYDDSTYLTVTESGTYKVEVQIWDGYRLSGIVSEEIDITFYDGTTECLLTFMTLNDTTSRIVIESGDAVSSELIPQLTGVEGYVTGWICITTDDIDNWDSESPVTSDMNIVEMIILDTSVSASDSDPYVGDAVVLTASIPAGVYEIDSAWFLDGEIIEEGLSLTVTESGTYTFKALMMIEDFVAYGTETIEVEFSEKPYVPPYIPDDDYVPLPPTVVQESNDASDTTTIVACAAAAVVAALMAAFLILEYRKD